MTVSIRNATDLDHDLIINLMRSAAQAGHFSATVYDQAPAILGMIARFGGLPMQKNRHGKTWNTQVRADLWVADWNGEPAAFILCLDDEDGYELHLAATQPQFQRRGCIRALTQYALTKAPAGVKIFARCYKQSIAAAALLGQFGFVLTKIGKHGAADELTLENPVSVSIAAPASTPAPVAPSIGSPITATPAMFESAPGPRKRQSLWASILVKFKLPQN
jgi:GNAT superfamily N-acetyltransferase